MNNINPFNNSLVPSSVTPSRDDAYVKIIDFCQNHFPRGITCDHFDAIKARVDTFKTPEVRDETIRLFCKTAEEYLGSIQKTCPALSPDHQQKLIFKALLPFYFGERTLEASVQVLDKQIGEMQAAAKQWSRLACVAKRTYIRKLTKDEHLEKLTEREFKSWLFRLSPQIEPNLKRETNRKLVKDLIQNRQMFRTYEVPVFKSLGLIEAGKDPKLPEHDLVPEDTLSFSGRLNGFYHTSTTLAEYSKSPKKEIAHEELVKIAQLIPKIDYIPWEYSSDGCYLRADLTNHILLLMGVSSSQLFKKYLLTPKGHHWDYHVAPCVRIGSKDWVVDPISGDCKPLEEMDWASKFVDPKQLVVETDLSKEYPQTDVPKLFTTPWNFQMNKDNGFFSRPMNAEVLGRDVIARHVYSERVEHKHKLSTKSPELYRLLEEERWNEDWRFHEQSFEKLKKSCTQKRSEMIPVDQLRKLHFIFLWRHTSETWVSIYVHLLLLQIKCELLKQETHELYGPKLTKKSENLGQTSQLIEIKLRLISPFLPQIEPFGPTNIAFLRWLNGASSTMPPEIDLSHLKPGWFCSFSERGWNFAKQLVTQAINKIDSKDPRKASLEQVLKNIQEKIDEQNQQEQKIRSWALNPSLERPSVAEFLNFDFCHLIEANGNSSDAIALCNLTLSKILKLLEQKPGDNELEQIKKHLEEQYKKLQSLLCDKILNWTRYFMLPSEELEYFDPKVIQNLPDGKTLLEELSVKLDQMDDDCTAMIRRARYPEEKQLREADQARLAVIISAIQKL